FSMVGMTLAPAPVIAVTLLLTLLLPLFDVLRQGFRYFVPLAAGVLGLVLIVVAGSPHYDQHHRRVNTLLYAQGIESEKSAVWMTMDERPDAWVSSFLQTNRRVMSGTAFFPFISRPVTVGDAPAVGLPLPNVRVVSNVEQKNGRRLTLRIT